MLIGRGQRGLPNLAALIPGLALLFGMLPALIYPVRSLIDR